MSIIFGWFPINHRIAHIIRSGMLMQEVGLEVAAGCLQLHVHFDFSHRLLFVARTTHACTYYHLHLLLVAHYNWLDDSTPIKTTSVIGISSICINIRFQRWLMAWGPVLATVGDCRLYLNQLWIRKESISEVRPAKLSIKLDSLLRSDYLSKL